MGTVEENVFECALGLVAEGAGVCVAEIYPVGIGREHGVVTAAQPGQVNSIFA